ncbi:MAG: hypothetical protein QOJ61_3584 [Mycobacterium sp.]|nr:hypothetical protein [Mycobacterium sp.]
MRPAGVECDSAAVDVGGPVANVLVDEWTDGCHLGVGQYPRGAGVDVVVALHVEGECIAGRALSRVRERSHGICSPHFPLHGTVPAIAHHWMPHLGCSPPNANR